MLSLTATESRTHDFPLGSKTLCEIAFPIKEILLRWCKPEYK